MEVILKQVRHHLATQGLYQADVENIADALTAIDIDTADPDVELIRSIHNDLSSLGPLVDPLTDPRVTDIVLNPNGVMWCDRGEGMQRIPLAPIEYEQARNIATRLANACGQRLDDALPYADGVLHKLPAAVHADAVRIHAMLTHQGVSISLRTLSHSTKSLEELCRAGLAPAPVYEMLLEGIHSRKNILFTGGTGTGKTTLLASVMAHIPQDQRIITVEDTPELMPCHPHTVALLTRHANAEGTGSMSMSTLIKQCLRMRPDRIIVGEIRGEEVADLLIALNTGHAGSGGTLHANSLHAVPGRLEALGAMAGMNPHALARQAVDGIDMIVHLVRSHGQRYITALGTLCLDNDRLSVQRIWNREGWTEST